VRIDKNSAALMLLGIEHEQIGQVLDVLDRQLDLIKNNEQADYKLIELAIDYFLTFPDTCHHPKEDLIFARVVANNSDEPGIMWNLIGEHKELSQLTHRVRHDLNSKSESIEVVNSIEPTLREFVNTYRHHIETENKIFFPYVLKNLSQEEFDVIDFDLFDQEDPLYDNETEGLFARLRDEIIALGNKNQFSSRTFQPR
jgi:hemerythrin-like domain-containing protein